MEPPSTSPAPARQTSAASSRPFARPFNSPSLCSPLVRFWVPHSSDPPRRSARVGDREPQPALNACAFLLALTQLSVILGHRILVALRHGLWLSGTRCERGRAGALHCKFQPID